MSAVLSNSAPKRKPTPRKRSRGSAKAAGARHEREVADYLRAHLDDGIDRRPRNGSKDRGDIGGVRIGGKRLVLEAKNTARLSIGPHLREAEVERGNDDALAGMVIYHRHGIGYPGEQVVLMTLDSLIALITGNREHCDRR